jgi:hypothetical protein
MSAPRPFQLVKIAARSQEKQHLSKFAPFIKIPIEPTPTYLQLKLEIYIHLESLKLVFQPLHKFLDNKL